MNLGNEITRATAAENTKANLNGGNIFTGGSQVLAGSATGYPSLNIPNGAAAPSNPQPGDVWVLNGNAHLQFQTMSGLETLAFTSDITIANNAQAAALSAEITRATTAEGVLSTSLAGEV